MPQASATSWRLLLPLSFLSFSAMTLLFMLVLLSYFWTFFWSFSQIFMVSRVI